MKPLKHKDWHLPKIPAKDPTWRKKDHQAGVIGSKRKVTIGNKRLYADLQGYRIDNWRTTVLAFETNPNSVYNAYLYIANHPMFWFFRQWKNSKLPLVHERHLEHEDGWRCVDITPHMIDPATNRISDDKHLNTKVEWWFEYGPSLFCHNAGVMTGHDHKRDGGAATYDEAIIKVAKSIHKHYGNDRAKVVTKWQDIELPEEPNGKSTSNP